jgi:hypothetical protein
VVIGGLLLKNGDRSRINLTLTETISMFPTSCRHREERSRARSRARSAEALAKVESFVQAFQAKEDGDLMSKDEIAILLRQGLRRTQSSRYGDVNAGMRLLRLRLAMTAGGEES